MGRVGYKVCGIALMPIAAMLVLLSERNGVYDGTAGLVIFLIAVWCLVTKGDREEQGHEHGR